MAGPSSIEWTDATWNPVAGCTVVSPGCTNCYAMRMAVRLEAMGQSKYRGTTRKSGRRHLWSTRIVLDEGALAVPLGWRKPRRIFVNSMSDLFHESVPDAFVARVWKVMEEARWHTYQVLTKPPARMRAVIAKQGLSTLPHVWLGTSVESAEYLHRMEDLRRTRAAVRFISFEPLLGSVGQPDLAELDWAIVGGESGPGCRPMAREWVEDLRVACRRQGVVFFVKQWGGRNKKATGRLLHGRTWDELPRA